MSYQPPFTITSEILNLVADISQQVGRLDASALNASPQLRKQNRIKTLAGTRWQKLKGPLLPMMPCPLGSQIT